MTEENFMRKARILLEQDLKTRENSLLSSSFFLLKHVARDSLCSSLVCLIDPCDQLNSDSCLIMRVDSIHLQLTQKL